MKFRNSQLSVFLLIGFLILIVGCSDMLQHEAEDTIENSVESIPMKMYEESPINDTSIVENKSIYGDDDEGSIVQLYVTVLKTQPKDDKVVYTLNDVNNYRFDRQNMTQVRPEVEVIFQEGSSSGPEKNYFGFNEEKVNAILMPRGHGSTMGTAQKSFKVKLYDRAGLWRGQKTINLNKHPSDLTRVRNKLSFDYFKLLPDFTSFRTQFVQLYIKDLSSENPDKDFKNYGLFTQIEHANKQYFKARGLNPRYHLYKAEYFEFFRYSDVLKNVDDPEYNKDAFEEILSIKGEESHEKLLKMLDDINDYSLDINTVIDRHFNRENYLTWLAVNVLFANIDTNSQNFFLYSPLSMDTWYFIPWDYDMAWGVTDQPGLKKRYPSWHKGISNYWGCVLHKRFFKDYNNILDLNKKIEELCAIINKEKTSEFLRKYYDTVAPIVKQSPDINHLRGSIEEFESEFKRLENITEENKKAYYENLEKPMPIFLGEPQVKGDEILFIWDASYDLQGDDLAYDFQVSTNPDFSEVVAEKIDLKRIELKIPKLEEGTYYYRVIIKDVKGNSQNAFDYFTDPVSGSKYHGIMEFTIK